MRRLFGQPRDSYRRAVADAIRMKQLKPVTSCDEAVICLTGTHRSQVTDGALFPGARRFARIKKPVFNKLHDDRPGQISDDFYRGHRKPRLHQLFIPLMRAPCVHINFLLPHRRQRDHRPDCCCRADPGTRLFPERPPKFRREIEFVTQAAQLVRQALTRTCDLSF